MVVGGGVAESARTTSRVCSAVAVLRSRLSKSIVRIGWAGNINNGVSAPPFFVAVLRSRLSKSIVCIGWEPEISIMESARPPSPPSSILVAYCGVSGNER